MKFRDDDALDIPGFAVVTPPASQALRHPTDLMNSGATSGSLSVADITVAPDDRYCFTVHKASGRPVITFCFSTCEAAFAAARDLVAMLPRVAHAAVMSGKLLRPGRFAGKNDA